MKSIFWRPLQEGDVVDIVAPGFSVSDEKLQAGIEFLQSLKLVPRFPPDLFGPDVVCGNTDEKRLRHLREALLAKDSKSHLVCAGGYGGLRLIEGVAKIKKPKVAKLFIGYSDATTLHNFFNQFWGWPTVHGPLLDRLGQRNLAPEQVAELTEVIFGQSQKVVFKNLRPLNALARKKRQVQGAVVGGSLAVTQTHLGTPFCKPPHGQILFFEDIGERGYKVDRMLKHMEMARYFKKFEGDAFGEFIGGEELSGESFVSRVIERFAETQKFPVFAGVPVGHGTLQWPLPLATLAKLECGVHGTLTVPTGAQIHEPA